MDIHALSTSRATNFWTMLHNQSETRTYGVFFWSQIDVRDLKYQNVLFCHKIDWNKIFDIS